ncbi:hypothetical protein [Chroococcidiopsis cubana]
MLVESGKRIRRKVRKKLNQALQPQLKT